MKQLKKFLRTICAKYHVNTRKVCFPIGCAVTMLSIYENITIFLCIFSKINEIVMRMIDTKFPIWCQPTTKTTWKCKTDSFGPVCQLWSVTSKNMRDSKPQRCVEQHKSLKVTQNAINRDN